MELEKIMLKDLIYTEYKGYGLLDINADNYLKENREKVISDYKLAESEGVQLYNSVEVRTQILKDNLAIGDDYFESRAIYQDVNLESISESLTEVTVEDLERQLNYYGSWQIHFKEGLYLLIEF